MGLKNDEQGSKKGQAKKNVFAQPIYNSKKLFFVLWETEILAMTLSSPCCQKVK
jgi:hypothetical protein